MAAGRVFILESPNPLDLLENRGERQTLEQVCRLVGHDAATFVLRDSQEFRQTLNYISVIRGSKSDKRPLFLHISAHGDDSGIGIGADSIRWADLAKLVQQMYQNLKYYYGRVILVISSCEANKQCMSAELQKIVKEQKDSFVPLEYIFVFSDDEVLWTDAIVTWTIFYREVEKLDFEDKVKIQALLTRLRKAEFGSLKYYRWDGNRYRIYPTS